MENLNFDTYPLVIPTWALSAIFNDDRSGLTDEDETKLNAFLGQIRRDLGSGHFSVPDDLENTDFRPFNDIDGRFGGETIIVDYLANKN